MSERPDDTTEPSEPAALPATRSQHAPGSYYYDDATGYEIYDPSEEVEEEEDERDEEEED